MTFVSESDGDNIIWQTLLDAYPASIDNLFLLNRKILFYFIQVSILPLCWQMPKGKLKAFPGPKNT